MRMPPPRFYRDMGIASIVAGVILLGVSHAMRLFRRVR